VIAATSRPDFFAGKGASRRGSVDVDVTKLRLSRCAGVLLAAASTNAPADGQQFLARYDGDATYGAWLGDRVASIGDLDGDGAADLLVSDPDWYDGLHPDAGAVFVRSGRDGSVLWSVFGGDANWFFGEGLARLGDLDGDGFDEVAVGGEFQAVAIFSPRQGTLLRTHLADPSAPSYFGFPIAATGDVNQDGTPDYVVGSFGGAYVYSGATGDNLYTWEPRSGRFGAAVDGAGDLDGDGFADVAVGAPDESAGGFMNGRVRVYSGRDGSVLLDLHGQGDGGGFGSIVRGGQDLDRDGVADLLVGSQLPLPYGSLLAYSGATGTLLQQWSGGPGDEFEISYVAKGVEFAGDLDLDGVSDVVVGASDGGNGGLVHVFSGRTGLPLFELSDPNTGGFGEAVAVVGDTNGDGLEDLLVGAPFAAPAGALLLYSGAARPVIRSIQPDRIDYRVPVDVTITGSGFLQGDQWQVAVGDGFASNVVVVDDATMTATIAAGAPGPADVTVSNSLGAATLSGGFRRTPAVELDGDWSLGGHATVRYLLDPGDGIVAIAGPPPSVTIPTPPYLGDLCVENFLILFIDSPGKISGDEFDLTGDVPDDPALSGIQILFQALIGPKFDRPGADATWSNCASVTLR
jgi:hypothetical protein